MESTEIVDTNSLLEPVTPENPTGTDIRQDPSPTSSYQSIKDARTAARAAERSSMFDDDHSEADSHWRKILDLAPDILKSHSKDLEVASWYTEALIRRYGFNGLRTGFTLIHNLIDQHWDGLFPQPDEDGLETRVAALAGLNGEGTEGVLIAPIRYTPITEGQSPGPFSFWQYQQALDIQKAANDNIRAEKTAKLGFNLEDIERAVNESSDSFFVNLRDDITTCIQCYRQISQLLGQLCGNDIAPPSSNIINTLEESLGVVKHIAKHKFPIEIAENAEDSETQASQEQSTSAPPKGSIADREAAFRQLHQISEFFRKTEPHSPISYVLEKAVKWGNMPLHELMGELIPDNSSRKHYSSLTGVTIEEQK